MYLTVLYWITKKLYSQFTIFLLIFTSVYRNLVFDWNGLIFSSFLFSLAFFRVRRFCIPHNSAENWIYPTYPLVFILSHEINMYKNQSYLSFSF